MITNGALMKRKGLSDVSECEKIPDDDKVWDYLGNYIAQLCLNLLYIVSVEKILIGGGIINQKSLMSKIHRNFVSLNNNYIYNDILQLDNISNWIKRTEFKNDSGIISAFSLMKQLD